MNADDKLVVRVGAVVLMALVAGVIAMVLFGNTRIAPTITVHIHFSHMAGLEEGADVHLAGKVVGQVTAMRLVPPGSVPESHPLYPAGGVTADVRIDWLEARRAAINGEYFVSSKGVLGKRYIEIGPPPNNQAPERGLQRGDQIRGVDPPILDRAVYNAIYNLNVSRAFMRELGPEMGKMTDALHELRENLEDVLPEPDTWDRLIADSRRVSDQVGTLVNAIGPMDRVDGLAVSGERTVHRASRELDAVRADLASLRAELVRVSHVIPPDAGAKLARVKSQLQANIARFDQILATVRGLVAMIERGEGTLGAIGNDPEFSDDARELGKIIKRKPWRLIGH